MVNEAGLAHAQHSRAAQSVHRECLLRLHVLLSVTMAYANAVSQQANLDKLDKLSLSVGQRSAEPRRMRCIMPAVPIVTMSQ